MHAHKQWHCYNFNWSLYFTVYINSKSHTVDDVWDCFYYAEFKLTTRDSWFHEQIFFKKLKNHESSLFHGLKFI